MSTNAKTQMASGEGSRPSSAEQRLKELGIKLPAPPEPFGTYVEAVQTGNLLFLTGMLPTEGREAKFIGRVGAELDVEGGRKAVHLAALNVLAVAREHLGSLGVAARRFRKRQEPLPIRVWRRQPSARHPGRAGSDFRSGRVEKRENHGREHLGENNASFPLAPLVTMFEGLPHGAGGFCDARIISIAGQIASSGPRKGPTKGKSRGTPDFLSHGTDRWALRLLQRGRPEGSANASSAARSSLFLAHVRAALLAAFGSLSPRRA